MLDSYIFLGARRNAGLRSSPFSPASSRRGPSPWQNWRCRQVSSRLTNPSCLPADYYEPGDVYPLHSALLILAAITLVAYYGIIADYQYCAVDHAKWAGGVL